MFAAQTALIIGAMFGIIRMTPPHSAPAVATTQEMRQSVPVATIPSGVNTPNR
ncbi:MAG: hypothetical protein G8237_09065 [Magnetococcales bacterium]|nr:hypothetical protein [Magnetococcales bacterium]NGZ06495.1 hypothetical protein [Magnetococcales bacterium]